MVRSRMRLSNLQIVALGYFLVILTGTLLLMLPISTQEGQPPTSVLDALFTAVSASCVTGLVVVDTGTHWTVFGQLVILGLIQIGGLGFMTISLGFLLLMRKRIGLRHREVMVESINSMQLGGIVRLTRKILYGTLLFEGLGALFLAIRFIPQFGWKQGAYFSVFHSISAFCNAGFDLFGNYNSIVAYADDALVNFTLMGLITMGGLGFLVWEDLWQKKMVFPPSAPPDKNRTEYILCPDRWRRLFAADVGAEQSECGYEQQRKTAHSLFPVLYRQNGRL